MSAAIAYRPDIDGLRAIAVVSVILCHFGVPGFAGGYIGVDVFFVISGFLITSIVLRDLADGTFTIAKFYERRARRILPAFLFVTVLTSVAAVKLFLPQDLVAFGKSLLASAVFATNVLFWQEGGYFAAPSELKPLLHTWSLSIEEQFYVIFPLLLSFLRRKRPRYLHGSVLTLLLLSLALCVWATGRREFAFYLLPSRAWELMAGALLATVSAPSRLSARARGVVGLAGLLGIMLPVTLYSNRTLFPGIAAALPCFASAAVVLAGPSGPVAYVLSRRVPVFLGRISYSLYLVHWPLLVFAKYYLPEGLGAAHVSALLVASLVLATLSWRFVETPFRRPAPARMSAAPVLKWAAAGLAMVALAGGVLVLGKGYPSRVPTEVLAVATAHGERDRAKPGCMDRVLARRRTFPQDCGIGAVGAAPSFALWGDSHAASVSGGVAAEALRAKRTGVLLSKVGCPPLLDADIAQGLGAHRGCRKLASAVLDYLESSPQIDRVLIVGRWSVYIHGQLVADSGAVSSSDPLLLDPQGRPTTAEDRAALLAAALQRTAQRLLAKGKRVYVNEPVPEIGWDVPLTLARLGWFHPTTKLTGPSLLDYRARNELAIAVLTRLKNDGIISTVSPQLALCGSDGCRVRDGEAVLYADGDHLSRVGSLLVAPTFRPVFEP
jgi:peptidoglycan/LPS O-acetylase OafA/YrhL